MYSKSEILTGCVGCLLSITVVGLKPEHAFSDDSYTENPGTEGNGDFVIGPDY